jgi:glycosyltransferase involved in cell wall biosynthesis
MIEKIKSAARAVTPDSVWGRLRAYRRPLNLHETTRFNFFPVSHDPLVIYTFTGWELGLGNVFHMSRSLDRPASFIVGFTRYAKEWKLRFLRRQFDRYRTRHPQHRIVLIANSKEELDRMRRFGFDARFVNKNAFQREDQFDIWADEEKVYDAVMTARMARWKRIELAQEVNRLAIITVVDEEEYYSEMRDVLPDTTSWMNFENHGSYEYLSRSEVCRVLNRSRTGLILSAREANNKASIEYLLSGVPVVSTPSKGGRDVFFDEEYCATVEAKPGTVREGVKSMAARDIDPEYIRQQTLDKIRDHRARFLSLVSDLTEEHYEASVDDWLDLYPRNLKFRCQPEHFRSFLESELLSERPEFDSSTNLRKHQPERWHSIVNGGASSRS